MAGTFDLNTYRCTYLPSSLWRVAHPESQARKDPVTGDVVAQDRTRAISDELSLKQAAERHFNWTNRQPSCFLSVFSSDTHARRWANQRERTHDLNSIGEVYIQEIDTTKLPADTYVFDAVSLAARLHISHQYSSDEFIFLHRIPGRSLRRTRSLGEIEEQGTHGIGNKDASLTDTQRKKLVTLPLVHLTQTITTSPTSAGGMILMRSARSATARMI
jgi:hypothetical protein